MIIPNQSSVSFLSVLPDGTTVPGQRDSNIVTTEIISVTFSKVKSTPTAFIGEGDSTTQTIVLTNNTNYVIKNLFFNDTLTAGASHVPSTYCHHRRQQSVSSLTLIVDTFSIRATILMTASIEDAIRASETAIEDAEIVDVNKRNFAKEDVNLTFPVTKNADLK